MSTNDRIEYVTKENEYLKKMLDDNFKMTVSLSTELSTKWIKLYKIVAIAFCTTIVAFIVGCGLVCNMYFKYAYDTQSIENQNTTTNINKNINEN